MRFIAVCMALATVFVASAAAQEILATEEWIEGVKLSRRLEKQQKQRHHNHQQQHHHHHHRSNQRQNRQHHINKAQDTHHRNKNHKRSDIQAPKLEKRVKGFPHRSEIEQRANLFKSFRADALVKAPANLRVVKKPAAKKKKSAAKRIKKAGKKVQKKVQKKAKKVKEAFAAVIGNKVKRDDQQQVEADAAL
ncbi:hypothetical protein BGZ94_007486 [Podila epigama]|nr:hypothetical protein BGZ94_007486 [Podila epigama]